MDKTYNREVDNRVFWEFSQDIVFDYTTGKYPTGDESGFFWESNYIPLQHTVNSADFTTSGPHVWKREKVGLTSRWSSPMPIGLNNSNESGIAEAVVANMKVSEPITNEDGVLGHMTDGYEHLPGGAVTGQILKQGISKPYWDSLSEYYTKANLITPGESRIHVDNVEGIVDNPITSAVVPMVINNGILIHEEGPGYNHMPTGGVVGQVIVNTSSGQGVWEDYVSGVVYTAGTGLNLIGEEFSTKDSEIDHDSLLNTHNLTSDIDHNQLTNYVLDEHIDHSAVVISAGGILSGGGDITASRELTLAQTDIDHDLINNTHNLTSDIDHNTIANTHNLTTDIDHDALTNFVADEHIDWKSTTENLNTTGTLTTGAITLPNVDGTLGQLLTTDGLGVVTWEDSAEVVSDEVLLADGSIETPSGVPTVQSVANEEYTANINAIIDELARLANASASLVGEGIPSSITTVETTVPFVTTAASTDAAILELNDVTDVVTMSIGGRYTWLTSLEIENTSPNTDHTVTIRTRDLSDDSLLTTREITIPSKTTQTDFRAVLYDLAELDAPQDVYITVQGTSNTVLNLTKFESTLSIGGVVGSTSDINVSVSDTDTTAGKLIDKIKFGDEFTVDTVNPSGNENLLTKFKGWIFNSARTFKHIISSIATADRTQILQDKDGTIALLDDVLPEPYESFILQSTLNNETENILAVALNKPDRIKFQEAGSIYKIKIDIDDLGSNANTMTINFKVNGLWLLASNHTVLAGTHSFTTLINNTVVEDDEFELWVTAAPGSFDVGSMKLYVYNTTV